MHKRMKLIGVASVVLAGVILTTGYLSAHPMYLDGYGKDHQSAHEMHRVGHDKHGHHRDRGMMRDLARLDLTDEQREQIHQLMDEKRKAMGDQKRSPREARQALQDAITAEPYDAQRVKQLAEERGAAVTKRILQMAEAKQQILALLTTEQRAKLDSLRSLEDSHRVD